ncbi:MAG TPA: glycoside hydrolase family 15 protein [Polyangia bacterium]|nr:glycoside hydrolase family 15 protein [Polyangia bacterium]
MPRDLPIGNGQLLINFDDDYRIRDLFYPHVGKENHVGGHVCRFGVFADGQFSWVEKNHGWTIELLYETDTLVTQVTCRHDGLGIALVCSDCVDFHASLFVRRVEVQNLRDSAREIRIFFHQDFRIAESDVGDTAAYDPESQSVIHYKSNRYLLCNLSLNGTPGVRYWAVGQKGQPGKEGTWRDAEDDGNLSGSAIAQGAVDSVIATRASLAGRQKAEIYYWIAVGPRWKGDWECVAELNQKVCERGPGAFLERTRNYWKLWVGKEPLDFFDLPPEVVDLYRRSLLVLRTQIDRNGAVIAANDTDITAFARDTYSYLWPRDGALVSHALDLAGHQEPPRRFFEFCADALTPEGYLLHKYLPDGTLGSSWHPWVATGPDGVARPQLPIQEDETALVIWALWRHFQRFRDVEDIQSLYGRLVKKAAAFMVRYRDPRTKLPLPSYDLWEERRGVMTFTCASVIGGLHAAAEFAYIFGETALASQYEQAAQEIRQGMDQYLWRPELGRFARMVQFAPDGNVTVDVTLDASLYGAFAFGAYPPDDPRVEATMKAVRDRLWCKTDVGGVARYENDYYHQVSRDTARVPGNPWFICTLWLAQYEIARARTAADLARALEFLTWVEKHSLPSGVLAEQVNPYSGQALSVAPLTWSHATVVSVVQEYLDRAEALNLNVPGTSRRFRKLRSYERPEEVIAVEAATQAPPAPAPAPAPAQPTSKGS